MKISNLSKYFLLTSSCITLFCLSGRTANAGLVINMTQVGSNVVAIGNGTLNTTALSTSTPGGAHTGYVVPNLRFLSLGASSATSFAGFNGTFTGPTSFGLGGIGFATSATGDSFFFDGTFFAVPLGYASNSLLSNTTTWASSSLAGLGASPGTYTWTWGTPGTPNADFITLNITAVPEPTSVALVGLSSIFAFARRKRQ
jgi:hypothetical protein